MADILTVQQAVSRQTFSARPGTDDEAAGIN